MKELIESYEKQLLDLSNRVDELRDQRKMAQENIKRENLTRRIEALEVMKDDLCVTIGNMKKHL